MGDQSDACLWVYKQEMIQKRKVSNPKHLGTESDDAVAVSALISHQNFTVSFSEPYFIKFAVDCAKSCMDLELTGNSNISV